MQVQDVDDEFRCVLNSTQIKSVIIITISGINVGNFYIACGLSKTHVRTHAQGRIVVKP